MIKKINSDQVLDEMCSKASKGIVIYGAGRYGKILRDYLSRMYSTEIKYFAVSSKEHIYYREIDGVKVRTIEEVAREDNQRIIVIAISEQKQQELLDIALKLRFQDIYMMLNEFLRYMQSELNLKRLTPLEALRFEVHIVDHCNLNCKGCYHFSPLSNECFLPLEEFERDLERISALCGDRVSHITLLGGEPLLHPQVTDYLYMVRKYFKKCNLELLTNGVLLKEMKEEFWRGCIDNKVILSCTKYPIKIDYALLEKIAESHALRITYHNDVAAGEKTLIKYPFDIQGTQPVEWNYQHCTRSNLCITLKHGRLFTCPMAAHAHLAKDYFNLDMELSENDSIDIYRAKSFEEITNFLVNPIPFCRYCNLKIKPEQIKWGVSTKSKEEWF